MQVCDHRAINSKETHYTDRGLCSSAHHAMMESHLSTIQPVETPPLASRGQAVGIQVAADHCGIDGGIRFSCEWPWITSCVQ